MMNMDAFLKRTGRALETMSLWATRWAGSSWAFALAALLIVTWLVTGPLFGYSNTWQLVINTGTTIITFLMVFLIQRAQNKDAMAIQLKLNEIVASMQYASNRLINVEDLTEAELVTLHRHYRTLAVLSKKENDIFSSHSVDEAERRHDIKQGGKQHVAKPPVTKSRNTNSQGPRQPGAQGPKPQRARRRG
jgi:low affinity Fe/Cu permease